MLGESERTEQPTPRRRQEARRRGNVARSADLNSALVLLTGIVILSLSAKFFLNQIIGIQRDIFQNLSRIELTSDSVRFYFITGITVVLKTLAPLIVSVFMIGMLANYLQVGVIFTGEPLLPRLDKINPITGFRRIFSWKALAELIKGILKAIIVGYIIYVTLRPHWRDYLPLMDQGVRGILKFLGGMGFKLALRTSLALLLLAFLDYSFQKWQYEKSLRMTKEEVKEEYKEHEGDPLIKARIRSLQREMARRRMLTEVPGADVVITNPFHIAVALKYDAGKMAAPRVVAKGARLLAEKIKEVAQKHGVPIVEDKPLAQALYKFTKVGDEIPVSLYKAVAEILAYIYRLKGKKLG